MGQMVSHLSNCEFLFRAIERGDEKSVRGLLDGGAKVDALIDNDWTPLHMAVLYNNLKITKLLLERGAAPNAKTKDGETPLDLAGSLKVVKLLLEEGAELSEQILQRLLILAARVGNLKLIEFLLDNGVDPTSRDEYENTAAHWAAKHESAKVLKQFLGRAPSLLNIKNRDGEIPYELANRANRDVIKKCLYKVFLNRYTVFYLDRKESSVEETSKLGTNHL